MNDEAIISQWNIDEYGNPISVKTEQETQVSVGGNLVQLRGIPDEMEGVTIEDKNGNTFFRVENLDEVYDSNYAYYLMKDGNVQFNPSQNGKLLYFKYYSKGVTLLSVSRIYYKDSYDNVVKILEDLIKAGFDALKVLEVFGGAKEVIDRLERDLDNGRALATQLEDVIAEGKPLQENLNADITEAKKWKDSLHKDVAEGKILQPQLHQDIIDGRETDANLTQTINSATELDDKIKTTGNASFIIEVDNWIASDDSDWAYMYSLTTSLNSSDLVFKTQEITTKGFEDCLLYSIVKDSNTIAFYTDDKVRTKVIINARQYGGTIQDFSVVNTDLISEGASNKYVTPQEKVNIGTIPDIKQQCELNKSSLEERVKKNELTLNIKDFGAKGNGVDNDNLAFIQCFDYAKSLSTLTTDGNKIKILIPYGLYVISNLVVPRNLNIECEGVLIVEGEGNVGLLCNMTLFSTLSHITIKLTQNNQKALVLTSSETTSSQLNTFNCLTVEGQHLLNSVGISLGRTWSNTFFSCKVFRCAKSLEFTDADSNANIFYNCELRSEKDSQNSIVAIHHLNGKNNMFIGGIIENYKECLINDNGDFKLIGVYTEDFKDDRGIILNGGSLTIDNSLLKTKIKINGGETLRLINIDGNRGALNTNTNSPLIMFYADVDTEIITENNNFPNELILCRYGQYFNGSDWITKSKNRDKIKSNEIYSYGVEGEITSVTGDNTDATIIFNKELINNTNLKEYDVSNGIFTPKYGGLFKVNVQCRLSNISSDNTDIVLFLKESNGKVFRLDNKKYEDRDNGNNVLLKGEAMVPLINLKNLRVSVRGNGTSKNINVSGGTGNNIFSWITIQRI